MIEKLDSDHYGLSVFEIDGYEYAIAKNEEEAYEAASKFIKQSLWTFDSEFILRHNSKYLANKNYEVINSVKVMLGKIHEKANSICLLLIDDIDYFIYHAIRSSSYEDFLSIENETKKIEQLIIDEREYDKLIIELKLNIEDINQVMLFRIN